MLPTSLNDLPKSEIRVNQIEQSINELFEYSNKSNDHVVARLTRQIQSNVECFLADSNDEYNDLVDMLEQQNVELLSKSEDVNSANITIDSLNSTISTLTSTVEELNISIKDATYQSNERELALTKEIELKKQIIDSLNSEKKTLNDEVKSYIEIKAMGGPNSVIKKLKEQKATLLDIKKKLKQNKAKPNYNVSKQVKNVQLGMGVKQPSYGQLEYAYKELEMLFQASETKLIDAQFQLASQENIVSMFSYEKDFLFTFPNLLVLGVDKNDKGTYNKKQMHRTLLYLSNQGVGGLLYLDDNDQVQMMSSSETDGVVPNNETSIILAKAWLKKLKLQQGKLRKEDLDLANFLNNNRSILPTLLNKDEILKLPDLVRCNKVRTKDAA